MVCSGCHHKRHRVGSLNKRGLLPTVRRLKHPRSRCRQILRLVRPHFLLCRWSPSHCVFTWWRAEALDSLFLFLGHWGSTLMMSSTLNYLPKSPPRNYHYIGGSTYDFGVDPNIQSITPPARSVWLLEGWLWPHQSPARMPLRLGVKGRKLPVGGISEI